MNTAANSLFTTAVVPKLGMTQATTTSAKPTDQDKKDLFKIGSFQASFFGIFGKSYSKPSVTWTTVTWS